MAVFGRGVDGFGVVRGHDGEFFELWWVVGSEAVRM